MVGWNVAVTVRADVIFAVQVSLSTETFEHPDHAETKDPTIGIAVSVTVEPVAAVPLHVPSLPKHAMSGSVSVVATVPWPVPAVFTVSRAVAESMETTSVMLDETVAVQVSLSVETVAHPSQPATMEPGNGSAVSVTVEPLGALPLHVPLFPDWQLIAGAVPLLVTVPEPEPETFTATVYMVEAAKVTSIVWSDATLVNVYVIPAAVTGNGKPFTRSSVMR